MVDMRRETEDGVGGSLRAPILLGDLPAKEADRECSNLVEEALFEDDADLDGGIKEVALDALAEASRAPSTALDGF